MFFSSYGTLIIYSTTIGIEIIGTARATIVFCGIQTVGILMPCNLGSLYSRHELKLKRKTRFSRGRLRAPLINNKNIKKHEIKFFDLQHVDGIDVFIFVACYQSQFYKKHCIRKGISNKHS